MLRVGDLVGAGFGFRGSDGIAWLVIRDLGTRGLVLLFAEPLRLVDWSLAGAQFGELVVRKHSTTVAIAGLTAYRNLDE
jgi:hypothetical protein